MIIRGPFPKPDRLLANRGIRAFTLIELLVVLGVIAIVAGLILPAVQAARESGRRLQCLSNLRQIGLAMNSYHTVHGMFPSSQLLRGSNWTSNCMSEHAYILPYIELQPLFSSINMMFANLESPELPSIENHTARNTKVSAFLCPGDITTFGFNTYRFNRGRFGMRSGALFDGPFSLMALPSDATVTDGLSTSAFVSERLTGNFAENEYRKRDVKVVSSIGVPGLVIFSDEQFIPICLASTPEQLFRDSGRYWMYSGFFYTHYNHNGVPNDQRLSCGWDRRFDSNIGLHPPRSTHPGGVGVLFGDGHVSFIADNINTALWSALGTHNSGEIASALDVN